MKFYCIKLLEDCNLKSKTESTTKMKMKKK